MTAKTLHEMTAPLFAKHPSAKPINLEFREIAERWVSVYQEADNVRSSNGVLSEHASLIIQGHLVDWLIGKQMIANNRKRNLSIDVSEHATGACRYCVDGNFALTLLESLIHACMEVE